MNTQELKKGLMEIIEAEDRLTEYSDKIEEMRAEQDKLCIPEEYSYISKGKAQAKSGYFSAFLLSILFCGALYLFMLCIGLPVILQYIDYTSPMAAPIIESLSEAMLSFPMIFMWLALSAMFSLIVSIGIVPPIVRGIRQGKLNKQYKNALRNREALIKKDKERIEEEEIEKDRLEELIKAEELKIETERQKMSVLYDRLDISEHYRFYDAVVYFYNCLDTKRTYGLTFNPETGDPGAYNIYSNDAFNRALYILINDMNENISLTTQELDGIYDELDSIHRSMSSYYNRSLQYQQQIVQSSQRRETLAAATAYEARKTARNTREIRRNTSEIHTSLENIRLFGIETNGKT